MNYLAIASTIINVTAAVLIIRYILFLHKYVREIEAERNERYLDKKYINDELNSVNKEITNLKTQQALLKSDICHIIHNKLP